MKKQVNEAYTSHTLRYVGIGLISGSVVHASTLGGGHLKYLVLIALGILMFLGGVLIEHRDEDLRKLTRYILISVIVSIGTGMVSGATQHYLDGPSMAAILLPLGFLIGYIAFAYRDYRESVSIKNTLSALLLAIVLWGGLSLLAANISPTSLDTVNQESGVESHGH